MSRLESVGFVVKGVAVIVVLSYLTAAFVSTSDWGFASLSGALLALGLWAFGTTILKMVRGRFGGMGGRS